MTADDGRAAALLAPKAACSVCRHVDHGTGPCDHRVPSWGLDRCVCRGPEVALLAHDVTLVPSLVLAAHWLPICSCQWVGSVQAGFHAAVTKGIDHLEAVADACAPPKTPGANS